MKDLERFTVVRLRQIVDNIAEILDRHTTPLKPFGRFHPNVIVRLERTQNAILEVIVQRERIISRLHVIGHRNRGISNDNMPDVLRDIANLYDRFSPATDEFISEYLKAKGE